MAEKLNIRAGSKVQLAFDVPMGTEPKFDMISTFHKSVDESAFLISVPTSGGKPMQNNEMQKFLIRSGSGANAIILAGYVDDVVQEGIRHYWKIRRVTQQRQFFQRADERLKVALRVTYMQDTWTRNSDGVIIKDDGLTLDISNGGVAFYLNHRFDVGEVCQISMPRIGTSPDGQALEDIIGVVCWQREAPKGSPFRLVCGLQFRFVNTADKEKYVAYVANVKRKYAL